MKEKRILRALGEVDNQYIEEAEPLEKTAKKISLRKWLSVAACLVLVSVIGIGLFQSGVLGIKTDVASLENGEKIEFAKSNIDLVSSDMDLHATAREMNDEEIQTLFSGLPVTAFAYFDINSGKMFGLRGEIDDMELVITKPNRPLLCTEIEGRERISNICGTPVKAGYFISDINIKGNTRIVYYAKFDLGDNCFFVKYGGSIKERDEIKSKLARTVFKLIENGELDFSQIKE